MGQICKLKYFIALFVLLIDLNMSLVNAFAQDSCTVDNAINGNLVMNLDELDTISSKANQNSIGIVDTVPGSINISCTNAATNIGISNVVPTNNVGMTLANFTTTISGLSSEIISHNGGASIAVPIGSNGTKTLEIDIDATYSNILKPGNYSFIVNLEALP